MRRFSPLVAIALLFSPALSAGENPPVRRSPVVGAAPPPPVLATTVGTVTATPSTISFNATDPDLGSVAGNSPATVSWDATAGNNSNNWTLTVQAAATSFTGCGTVPVGAVTVACSSASVSAGGGTGVCSGAFPLSTLSQQVAGGKEGNGTRSYTVNINFTLTDRWRYVAALSPPCTITLTYTVNAQ